MKALLAVVSSLLFVAALPVLLICFVALEEDVSEDASTDCTAVTSSGSGVTTESCTTTDDENDVAVVFALLGGALLVSGAVLAAASVAVRHPDERRAPAPWQGGPPRR